MDRQRFNYKFTKSRNVIMTHQEGNKLIAEFMGWESNIEDVFDYYSSWDWLMSVVEKIENMEVNNVFYEVLIGYCFCSIRLKDEKNFLSVSTTEFECNKKIDAVWKTVIKFIQATQ